MADPFRLRVLKALCDEIKKVRPTSNRRDGKPFKFDLRDYLDEGGTTRPRVFRGREVFGTSDPLPLVSVLEDPRPLEQDQGSGANTSSKGEWDLIIQGFVEDDPDHPTDPAHVLAAEVISVLAAARERKFDILGLGSKKPCITDIKIGTSPVVRPADDNISTQAFFVLKITLDVMEDLSNPFA